MQPQSYLYQDKQEKYKSSIPGANISPLREPKQGQPVISDAETFINELTHTSEFPALFEFKERSTQLIKASTELIGIIGSKASNYFEIPRLYLQNFINKCHSEYNMNYSIMKLEYKEVLHSTETYIDLIRKMTKEIPQDQLNPVKEPLLGPIKCTLDQHNMNNVLQKAYHCETCGIAGDGMVCEGCVKSCHVGHKVNYRGFITGFCDCRFETDKCKLIETCTLKQTGSTYVKQPQYICHSCNMNESKGKILCKYCVDNCHKNHMIEYLRTDKGFCDCDELYNFCHLHKSS